MADLNLLAPVAVKFIGPDPRDLYIGADLEDADTFATVNNGDVITVPYWRAHGHPGEPGVQLVDGEEVPWTHDEGLIGEPVQDPGSPPRGGLLDQVDVWELAKTPKAKPDEKPAPATDTEGEGQ